MRRLIRRLANGVRRRAANPALLATGTLESELARRLERMPARKAASLVERLVVNSPRLRRHVATVAEFTEPMDYERAQIRLHVSSDAIGNRLRAATKEPFTVDWLDSSFGPGEVLYDIGANVGPYTLIAAKLGGRVVAFEPSPTSYADLCRNAALNDAEVIALPFALWDETRLVDFAFRTLRPGDAQHRVVDGGGGTPIVAARLDDLVREYDLPPATHVKLDVDGGEAAVIRGGPGTFGRCRTVIVEGDDPEVMDLLIGHGLHITERHERDSPGAPVYLTFAR